MKPIKWEISPEKRTLYKRIYEITWPAFVELVMSTMFGSWLDAHGNAGYNMIFTFLGSVAAAGVVLSFIVMLRGRKHNA